MSLNNWNFSGRVGADAELRKTNSGESVLSFRVANDVGFGNSKTTQWVSCSFWGKRGEAVADFIKKGQKITVVGELKLESYTNKQGAQESKLAVRVIDVDLPARSDGASTGGYAQDHQAPLGGGGGQDFSTQSRGGAGGRGGGKPAFDQDLDDQIPFVCP